jgi:hypothetical protein
MPQTPSTKPHQVGWVSTVLAAPLPFVEGHCIKPHALSHVMSMLSAQHLRNLEVIWRSAGEPHTDPQRTHQPHPGAAPRRRNEAAPGRSPQPEPQLVKLHHNNIRHKQPNPTMRRNPTSPPFTSHHTSSLPTDFPSPQTTIQRSAARHQPTTATPHRHTQAISPTPLKPQKTCSTTCCVSHFACDRTNRRGMVARRCC